MLALAGRWAWRRPLSGARQRPRSAVLRMTYGKPELGDDPVRCIACGEQYPERDIILEHAGRIDVQDANRAVEAGDYWNDRCPHCRKLNTMKESYAQMTEEEFQEEKAKVEAQRREALEAQGAGC